MESVNPLVSLYGKIYGPLYFSTLLSTGLYGITCMQTFYYYVHYTTDSPRMKIFVAILWALDTIHEALTVSGVYKYIMGSLANPLGVLYQVPELPLQLLSETLVSIPVQAFFVYRIYIFSGKHIVAPLLWVIQAACQIVTSVLYVVKTFYIVDGRLNVVGSLTLDDNFHMTLSYVSLSLAAIVDTLIAIYMTFLLLRTRSTTGIANTADILQRLTVFAVNTGTWTAAFALLAVIVLHIFPPSALYFVLFGIPLSSLYCNTLLANLNARAYIRSGKMTPVFDGSKVEAHSRMVFTLPTGQKTTEARTSTDVAGSTTVESNV